MTYRRRLVGIFRDARAQAMTEYVLVMPVVLLLFFAMLQTMYTAKASQLTTYAAFAAARSYATSFSKFLAETGDASQAQDKAEKRAKDAALLVMAPISHAQVGEAVELWNPMRAAVKGSPQIVQQFYGIAEGYVTAMIYRMKNFSVSRSGAADDPTAVVRVRFDYLAPIMIPGFSEMWNYLHTSTEAVTMDELFDLGAPFVDPGSMSSSFESILDGLAALDDILGGGTFSGIQDAIDGVLDGVYGSGFAGARHNVTLPAKGICGFEPWSGEVRTDDIEDYCEGEFDESLQPCIDAAEANDELVQKQAKECQEANDAKNAYDAAVADHNAKLAAYNSCPNPSGDTVGRIDVHGNPVEVKKDCESEWDQEQDAQEAEDEAFEKAEKETEECEEAGEAVDDNRQAMEDACT